MREGVREGDFGRERKFEKSVYTDVTMLLRNSTCVCMCVCARVRACVCVCAHRVSIAAME